MVLPLAPVKFYGGSLPRPWIYGDVKFNSERIDPPSPPSAPLLSWANEAHWSMGGLCSKRKRMQGKIEGSIKKLRALEEEEDEAEDLAISRGSKASKLTSAHAIVADEGIVVSGVETNEKHSSEIRTRAKKSGERDPPSEMAKKGDQRIVVSGVKINEKRSSEVRTLAKKSGERDLPEMTKKGDQSGSGLVEASGDVKAVDEVVGFRVSPRNKKRKGESRGAVVEPGTSKCDKSVRRSARVSSPALMSSRVSTRSSGSCSVSAM